MSENYNPLSNFPKLKSYPIFEAIFEIKWKLWKENQQTFTLIDKEYKFFPGRFYEMIKDEFTYIEILENTRIPDEIDLYLPRFRFRKN